MEDCNLEQDRMNVKRYFQILFDCSRDRVTEGPVDTLRVTFPLLRFPSKGPCSRWISASPLNPKTLKGRKISEMMKRHRNKDADACEELVKM